ncbi:hypothetical protein [Lacipirellula sp.]|uniref:hypothetical protein n=1 Tax=Lacipirellula sp. TaxID=2691419 RepID=UPI003D13E4BF
MKNVARSSAPHLPATLQAEFTRRTKTTTENTLDQVKRRLKVRGDTFLDSDGEKLLADLEITGADNPDADKALKEIEHRRSEKIERTAWAMF